VTRVIAGLARGRRLGVPAGPATRPTSDRAREGLFSTLVSMVGRLAGRRVLDLYAGSGAIGLEALSRGAGQVLLVESDRRAYAAVLANIEAVGLTGAAASAVPVERLVAGPNPAAGYDVVVLDPPYALPAVDVVGVLVDLLAYGWVGPEAVVVVERASRDPDWVWPAGLAADRSRRYGEATLWYGRAAGPATTSERARS
jgi:16S rRNA (guanine966-N2)-methyltransferase